MEKIFKFNIEVKGAKHLKELYRQIDKRKIELALTALHESLGDYGLKVREIILSESDVG